jgi:hypothetical protein
MAFVNEYIPKANYKKYDFDGLNKRQQKRNGNPVPKTSATTDAFGLR